jgi:phosphoglycerol transferase
MLGRRLHPAVPAVAVWAAVLAGPVLLIYFRLGLRELHRPVAYGGDVTLVLSYLQNILLYGAAAKSPGLGYPYGGDLAAFPIFDTASILLLRLLSWVTQDVFVATNLFNYAVHVLNAALAYACLRVLRIARIPAVAGALSFALLEFALFAPRVYGHQTLQFTAPLAIGAALSLVPFRIGRPWPRSLLAIGLGGAVLIGLSQPYWIAFSTLALGLAVLMLLLAGRVGDAAYPGGAILVIGATALLVWLGPALISHSDVPFAAPLRHWSEQPVYGLHIPDLLIPPRSSWTWLQEMRVKYLAVRPGMEGADAYLGLVGVAGALAATFIVLAMPFAPRTGFAGEQAPRAAAFLFFALAFFALTNGGGELFNIAISPVIRAQNRVSPMLAFYCIFIAMGLAEKWIATAGTAPRRAALAAVMPIAALAGILDQTAGLSYAQEQAGVRGFLRDRQFLEGLQARLPAGAPVFQLPVLSFPEDGSLLPALGPFDHMAGGLFARQLQWSFGLARDNNGYQSVRDKDVSQILAIAAARGFQAVMVTKRGYPDEGRSIARQLGAALQEAPIAESPDYVVFSLSKLGDGREAPAMAAYWSGLSELEYEAGRPYRWDDTSDGTVTITVANRTAGEARLRLRGTLAPIRPGRWNATLALDGAQEEFTVPTEGVNLSREFVVPPGRHRIRLHVDTPTLMVFPDPRHLHYRIFDLSLVEAGEEEATKAVQARMGALPAASRSGGTDK